MSATRVRRPSRYSGIAQPAGSADPDANAGRRRAARSYCSIEIRDRDPISVGGVAEAASRARWRLVADFAFSPQFAYLGEQYGSSGGTGNIGGVTSGGGASRCSKRFWAQFHACAPAREPWKGGM